MVITMLSARQAALRLGFATSNPILAAIEAGELPAQRAPGRRNGKPGNFRIAPADLDAYAKARGIGAEQAEQAEVEAPAPLDIDPVVEVTELPVGNGRLIEPDVFNVAAVVAPTGVVAPAAPLGFVTIPIEHYAALVADRGELEFTKRHFELKFKGWGK